MNIGGTMVSSDKTMDSVDEPFTLSSKGQNYVPHAKWMKTLKSFILILPSSIRVPSL